jgi:oligopeptide transport system substrate-binding protein
MAACVAQPADRGGSGGVSTPAAGQPAPDRSAGTLRVGLGRDPASIDPRHLTDDEGEFVVRALFDGLVDVAPNGSIVPASAHRWEVEDDGLTYRFHLSEDRFHDGETVTAQHHADALLGVFDPDRAPRFRDDLLRGLRGAERAPDPESSALASDAPDEREASRGPRPERGLPTDVLDAGGIEVVGPGELVLRLTRPDALLLHQLADPALVPLPRVAVLDPDRFALEPIGNGPFRMLGPREPGAFIRLAPHAEHRHPPRIDGLVLQIYATDADRSQRWADLLAGRLQITAIPPERRDQAVERFGRPVVPRWGSGLHDSASASLYAYAFALDVAPFDDVRLRRAISAAIDRDRLAVELSGAGVEPAQVILPPDLGGEATECRHCVQDLFLARELFDDWAGEQPDRTRPLPITLTYPRGAGHATIAERIAADLEGTLDVTVRLQSRDLAGIVREVTSGDAPLFRYGLRASMGGEAAGTSMVDPAFRPGALENWVRWDAPGTGELLDRLAATRAPELARTLEAQLLSEAAVIPLLWTRHDIVAHPDLAGFRLDPTGRWWPELVHLR